MLGAIIGDIVGSIYEEVGERVSTCRLRGHFAGWLRTDVSIGGDTDTLCAIAGSVAEAYYGIPEDISETAKSFLTYDLLEVVEKFYNKLQKSQY